MNVASATAIGGEAHRRLGRGGTFRTLATFERSVLVSGEGGLLALVDKSIGNGPLNVVFSPEQWRRIAEIARPEADWTAGDGALRGHGVAADVSRARIWTQAPWPPCASANAVLTANSVLGELLGLGGGETTRAAQFNGACAAALQREVDSLAMWLATPIGAPPLGLVGLGPGLTPSGDDILAGVMVTANAFGSVASGRALAAAVTSVARSRTSPLAAALLNEAADGRAGEDHVRAVAALVAGQGDALSGLVAAVVRHGASSGRDFLAGARLAAAHFTGAPSAEC